MFELFLCEFTNEKIVRIFGRGNPSPTETPESMPINPRLSQYRVIFLPRYLVNAIEEWYRNGF